MLRVEEMGIQYLRSLGRSLDHLKMFVPTLALPKTVKLLKLKIYLKVLIGLFIGH